MKWLATFLCLLAITPAFAEPPPTQEPKQEILKIPLVMFCTDKRPDRMLEERFGELGFIEGKGAITMPNGENVYGKFRMFLNPSGESFTVIFEGDTLSCLLMTGEDVGPMSNGNGI